MTEPTATEEAAVGEYVRNRRLCLDLLRTFPDLDGWAPADAGHASEVLSVADRTRGTIARVGYLISTGAADAALEALESDVRSVAQSDPALWHTGRVGPAAIRAALVANNAGADQIKHDPDRYGHSDTGRRLVTAIRRTLLAKGEWNPPQGV
jgi:hypothetical protein